MSIREVSKALFDLQLEDERVQVPGNCRYAAKRMFEVAKTADRTPPAANIAIVVWRPEESAGKEENAHFALQVSNEDKSLVFNPTQTPLFPRYNGPVYSAPGFLKGMKQTNELDGQKIK